MFQNVKGKFPEQTPQEYKLEEMEMAQNPEHRTPIMVCVDCSFSMRTEHRLERVIEGLQQFCRDMAGDVIARQSVELCIISYGGDMARVVSDFALPKHYQDHMPELRSGGGTPLIDAVETALECFERRKRRYGDNGISYNRPWLILIGDADKATASKALNETAAMLRAESDAKHLKVLCIIVGEESKIKDTSLMRLSPDGKVQYLRDLKFNEFFGWLSRSIQTTSMSFSGEEAYYEPVTSWGEVIERRG